MLATIYSENPLEDVNLHKKMLNAQRVISKHQILNVTKHSAGTGAEPFHHNWAAFIGQDAEHQNWDCAAEG